MKMIVVTAPTGNIGSKVLQHLLASDAHIRFVARNPAKLSPDIRSRVELIEGSHGDRGVVTRAFDGADSVFWLVTSDPRAASADAAYVDFSRPAIDAFRQHGIARVVGISSVGRGWPRDAGYVSATLKLDDLIAESGVAYRALAVGSLMENALRQAASIKAHGVYSWPAPPNTPVPAVASSDVAAVAARLLLDASWTGVESVPLKGPADITHAEMARTMSDVLGRPVEYRQSSMTDLEAGMIARGASAGMARAMVAMLTAHNEGMSAMDVRPSPTNTPTTFREWCETVLKPAVDA